MKAKTAATHVGASCHWPRISGPGRWCLVKTEYRRERLAEAEILSNGGPLVYVPRFKTSIRSRRNPRKWEEVTRPLFPGYLFVDLKADRKAEAYPWGFIETRRGVAEVVKAGEHPILIPDGVVDGLRLRQGENFGQPYSLETAPIDLKPGQKVRLIDGPFTGWIAEVERVDERDRITVLLAALGGFVPISGLEADQVEKT